MKSIGVDFECEKAERQEKKQLIGDHLEGELRPFLFKIPTDPQSNKDGMVYKNAPIVKVVQLEKFIKELLDKYSR